MKKEYNEDFYRWWLEFNMRWFNDYVYPILNGILAIIIKRELSGKKYGTTKSFESSIFNSEKREEISLDWGRIPSNFKELQSPR